MRSPKLDEVDGAILHALQEDASNNTNAAISERVSVPASTVGKRMARLEEGIIKGHRSEIDYEAAGFPLHVLFICTAKITDRASLIEQTLEFEGVINVRELMTGRGTPTSRSSARRTTTSRTSRTPSTRWGTVSPTRS